MVEEAKNPNLIYIVPDLLQEIFLALPLKSILKFKTVSKQWRSILESKMFVERRLNAQKKRCKILAAYNCGCDCDDRSSLLRESRFEGDEEIVYLHCDAAQPSMTCDGLVCIPAADWVNVLNPSTRQVRRFRCGPDPVSSRNGADRSGKWAMGFGRDKVTGSYKVVRMLFDPVEESRSEILSVETGDEWRKLSPPPYKVDVRRKSVCVNGAIYWLNIRWRLKILALDLHTKEYHDVSSVPDTWSTRETEIVNLEDRLAIATTKTGDKWKLVILSMNAEEETWSKTYSISLTGLVTNPWDSKSTWFRAVTVSKLGNVVFCNNHKSLFKYYPETKEIRCLSSDTSVISPYVENLVPLGSASRGHLTDMEITTYRCGLFSKHSEKGSKSRFWIREFVFTSLVIVGYIWIPRLLLETPKQGTNSIHKLNIVLASKVLANII